MKNNHFALGTRRTFLKNLLKLGLGSAAVNSALAGSGLLWARGALAADSEAPKRFITIHVTNGAHADTWHAQGTGRNFTLPEGSAPFDADGIREHCVFLNGLTGQGGHGVYHQCVSNNQRTSIDVYAASKLSAASPYSMLQLAAAPCGGLSRVNGTGLPFELDPLKIYERLFPEPMGAGTKDWLSIRRQGVAGANLKMLQDFRQKLSPVQQERLDLHTESVEAMRQRLVRAASGSGDAACSRPFWNAQLEDTDILGVESPNTSAAAVDLRTKLHMELIALAFKCDLTRVATFSFGDSGASLIVPGVNTGWHDCQHGYQNELKNPKGRKWFSEQMVYLMNFLANETDTDGSRMLDNTLIYLCSDMGNGSAHNNVAHPTVLAGGLVDGGQSIDMGNVSWDPLFDTIGAALGLIDESDYPQFGNDAGVISGVLKA